MQLSTKIIIALFGILTIVIVCGSLYIKNKDDLHAKEKAEFNNKIAGLSETVKLSNESYAKQIQTQTELGEFLKTINKDLAKKLNDMESSILAISSSQIKIKDDIADLSKKPGGTTIINNPDGSQRHKVEIDEDYWNGYLKLSGLLTTNPREGKLLLKQTKEIKITSGLTRNEDGSYGTFVNFPPDFPVEKVTVDGRIDIKEITKEYQTHWYQRFFVGGGLYASKNGLAIGPQVGYKFNNVLVAPSVMIDTSANSYYGASVMYNIGGK